MATKKAAPKPEPDETKDEVVAVQLDDLKIGRKEATKFGDLCEQVADLNKKISKLEKQKKDLVELVKGTASLYDLPPKIAAENFTYTASPGETRTIQAHLLLQAGVTQKIIDKATKVSKYTKVTITGIE